MYFWVNTYIIQTAGFTYIQIQTCRVPDGEALLCACPEQRVDEEEFFAHRFAAPGAAGPTEPDVTMMLRWAVPCALCLISDRPLRLSAGPRLN